MANVEHLLKLSDEYQVKQHIFDPCVKFLEDQTKTKENVMKILPLANLFNLEKVRQACNDLLKNMKLKTLSETVHLQDLDKKEVQFYLTQRIERLETFAVEMYPQFMGLLASLMWLLHEAKKGVSWCSKHVSDGKWLGFFSSSTIKQCSECSKMLSSMVTTTTYATRYERQRRPVHGYNSHFNSKLFTVMDDLFKTVR